MKVSIVGGANRTKDLAPFDDEEWEIWMLGNHVVFPIDVDGELVTSTTTKRVSRIFEIHKDLSHLANGYAEKLASSGIPLVINKDTPIDSTDALIYPLDEILGLIGGHLTSSIAYMMALAIFEGAKEIEIYGVDMDVSDFEYGYQRPGLYAWKGYAEAKGIKVSAPKSALFNESIYPNGNFKDKLQLPYTQDCFGEMAQKHQDKIDDASKKISELQRVIDVNSGCRQVYERLIKIARATESGLDVKSIADSTEIR